MGFQKCNNKRCLTCIVADVDGIDYSGYFKYSFCKISHVVYRITCKVCSQSYIGQTGCELHLRLNLHRSLVKRCNNNSTFEIKHFNLHGFGNIVVQILGQFFDDNIRLEKENYFILYKKSLYPYGLNTVLNQISISNDTCIFRLFNFFTDPNFTYNRGCRGSRNGGSALYHSNIVPLIFLTDLHKNFSNNLNVGYLKSVIFGLRFGTLRKLQKQINTFKCDNVQFIDIIKDLLIYKIGKPNINNDIDKLFFVFLYQQKSFDFLNFNNAIYNFKHLFPVKNVRVIPTFRYTRTFGSFLFNYKQVAQNLEEFVDLE